MADDDDDWRFSVDDVGPDDPEGVEDDGSDQGGVTGSPDSDGVEGEWVTTVGEDDDGPTVGVATGDSEETESDGGNVAGSLVPERPVESGTPGAENAVFATAGAVLTALVFAGVVVPLDLATAGAITASVAGGAALLYVLFRRF